MFRFNDPLWLWTLLLLPFLGVLFLATARARARALERFADAEIVQRLVDSVDVVARRWKSVLQLLAVALLAVALARPQFGSRVETVRSTGQDIVIAVDLSMSMLAEDVRPSRLDRARLTVLRILEQLDGDRVGLVAFAADAFVQSPLTVDYRAAAMFLNAMHPDMMPVQGTDLGQALRVSLEALEDGARDSRVLILITDAEDHEADYQEALEALETLGGGAYVVLVGTSEGAPIPLYDEQGNREGFLRDEDGSVVTTRVGESVLADLSDRSGVRVVRATGSGTEVDDFIDEVASGTGDEIDARQVTRFEEQYQIFLGLALLLLVAESMISDRKREDGRWTGRFE